MDAVTLARPNLPADRPNPIVQTGVALVWNFSDAILEIKVSFPVLNLYQTLTGLVPPFPLRHVFQLSFNQR
jgi:hypothetical protein